MHIAKISKNEFIPSLNDIGFAIIHTTSGDNDSETSVVDNGIEI